MIKELLIIWDDDTEMFYHDYYCSELFSDVLDSVIKRYGLKGKIEGSETYSLFKTNDLNKDYAIRLVDQYHNILPLF